MPKWMAPFLLHLFFHWQKWGFGFEHLLEWNNHDYAYGVRSIAGNPVCVCSVVGRIKTESEREGKWITGKKKSSVLKGMRFLFSEPM
ncbi:MAG: hypothetical protein JOS17DRAFT_738376 [Linnemannia elongata]|nr:MAG: hypothetical protein JOS17DRAFT_738376 [Linnemannia elongata]